MAIPVYLWLYSEDGKLLKGGVDVNGREGSNEIVSLQHNVEIQTDDLTGKPSSTRQHETYIFNKEIDSSSPVTLPRCDNRPDSGKGHIQVLPHQR